MLGNEPHTPKWVPILGVRLSMDSQIQKSIKFNDCKGQNPLDWDVPYIIIKLLEPRCLKLACMTDLDTQNTSYDQKKGWESNW